MTKTRAKRSKIWKIDSEEFARLYSESKSVSDLLRTLGLRAAGGNHKTVRNRALYEGLDVDEMEKKGKKQALESLERGRKRLDEDKIFVRNSVVSRNAVRKRMQDRAGIENYPPYVCDWCGLGNTWNGRPITLVLDHINGEYNDHRIENLRWLCPNCNSQTDTFCGRNI